MFTGLIETVGTIEVLSSRGNYSVLTIGSALPSDEITIGESIACDGACLTVVSKQPGKFVVEASQVTLELTTLGDRKVGDKLNLERALQVGNRLGGHFVSGHIDAAGTVDHIKEVGESTELVVAFDPKFDRWVIDQGSIAINGISLTVTKCRSGRLAVNLIPHTLSATSLGTVGVGMKVNLEFDVIGKYVAKMTDGDSSGVTTNLLKESGW